MNLENIRRIINTDPGQDLKEFILSEINKLKDLDNIKVSLNPITTTIELRATEKAYRKLLDIYRLLVTVSGDLQSKDPKDNYD
jgi:uncharacterized protein YqgV (UPF0045/DUF77 family)